ncbi:MAG: osmoprotectant transport system permease protein [Solirubrobacteraceae bacterium]|jgi:osmoprotectant transport system permease protein|nr:osmoprotectant transport system permease protein [Solirubrobacteraceae bacterium]MEA2185771.1 osmoprotectant transport system permease protein [Solirubrobacteraceae bacterium]MEA2231507.1 osmoprotectant transport system permease protein [Solirubrobacteraceae bacterium]
MSLPLTIIAQGGGFVRSRAGETGCPGNDGICLNWILDHLDRYQTPFIEHVYISVVPVAIGFAIALSLGLLAHRLRWLITPLTGLTSALYTVPSIAAFLLLLPVTGRGNDTAIVALTAYTLVIIFRNVITGLAGVPKDSIDAARGMGLTSRQLLFGVELPLALPEILAGLRIAAATTVGLAAFAYLAGAGGLGRNIDSNITFKGNVLVCGVLLTLLAAALDLTVLTFQRFVTPWRRAASS